MRNAHARSSAALAALVALVLVLSGCSQLGATGHASFSSSPTPVPSDTSKPTTMPPPVQKVEGVPADLTDLIKQLYTTSASVPSTPIVGGLLGRKPVRLIPGDAKGSVAEWGDALVAVVTTGDDATLAVKNPNEGWHVAGGWWPSLDRPGPFLGGKQFVLAIGSDGREGEDWMHTRSDAMQLIGVDGTGGGGLLGIPRDSWVPLSTGGMGKINSAMVFGGPEATIATMSNFTHLPVQRYLIVDFIGFIRMLDWVNHGITVDVPTSVTLVSGKVLRPGLNSLDAGQALELARERHSVPEGDFSRSFNQGQILLAGAAAALGRGPGALPEYIAKMNPFVRSDMSADEILDFFAWTYKIDMHRVGHQVCKGTLSMSSDGQSIVLPGAREQGLFAQFADGNL